MQVNLCQFSNGLTFSATATQRIIPAIPFGPLHAQININSALGGLLRAAEKMQIGFLLFLCWRSSVINNREMQHRFFLQNSPCNRDVKEKIHTDLISVVKSLLNPYWDMNRSYGCWLFLFQIAVNSLPFSPLSAVKFLDLRFSYNKIFLASLSGVVLVLLTVKSGIQPNKFGRNPLRGNNIN